MSQSSSMSDVSNGDDDNNDNNNINNNNNKKDADDNDDSTSRGRRRPPASRRGTRSRAGTGRRRPAAGARSRSASASRSAADLDGDDDDNDIAQSTPDSTYHPPRPDIGIVTECTEDEFRINESMLKTFGYNAELCFVNGSGSVIIYEDERFKLIRRTVLKDQAEALDMFTKIKSTEEFAEIIYGIKSTEETLESGYKEAIHEFLFSKLTCISVTPVVPAHTDDLKDPIHDDELTEKTGLTRFDFGDDEDESNMKIDMHKTPRVAWKISMPPTETSTSMFTAADKDFYPINFSEQEVSEALKRGRGLTCPGQGPCSFSDVGGLGETIDIVRKTIRLPLLCPEFYSEFRIRPKKGLIFYGPPGVGKTMTARALADACKSYTNHRIAFFMRKGSDILNSYVGQSEANVTKLFDAARQMSPSIIFLDEFDALGSIRTPNSHNHVESNVVSTLLALMDGLDDRGMVFVIAATNRLDAIDPAFRRPGRFDVEICFKVPDQEARKDILSKVTSSWTIDQNVIDAVAKRTDKFNGADLVALCEAAALEALERVNPTMVDCSDEDFPEELSITDIEVTIEDFEAAFKTVKSSCKRLQDK